MSICANCEKHGKGVYDSFTSVERIYMVTSACMMLRSLQSVPHAVDDRIVANSVITKVLLSFDKPVRHGLINYIRNSMQMDITLDSCPHGLQVVST